MRPVLAVTGTKREGAVLVGAGIKVIAGGGDAAFLARELAREAKGAAGIISFGMAGALDPGLRIGDWVIGDRLVSPDETSACTPRWMAALKASLPASRIGPIYADGRLIAAAADKAALYNQFGALAADMESLIAARAAAEAGVPFAILRCISDEAGASLPPAIAVAMQPGGGLALGAILRSILSQPTQLSAIIQTLSAFNHAYAALKTGGNALTPRLAF